MAIPPLFPPHVTALRLTAMLAESGAEGFDDKDNAHPDRRKWEVCQSTLYELLILQRFGQALGKA